MKRLLVLSTLFPLAMLAAPEPKPQFVLNFVNGDKLHISEAVLSGRNLTFRPTLAPRRPVTIGVAKVESLTCVACSTTSGPSGGGRLVLRDGSVLRGALLRLTKTALAFKLAGVGTIAVPLGAIESYTKGPGEVKAVGASKNHSVVTNKGDRVQGSLSATADGKLLVSRAGFQARLDYSIVRAIQFPPNPAYREATGGVGAGISLLNGTRLQGFRLSIAGGRISMSIAGGRPVSIAAANIARIEFTGSGAQRKLRRILVWGKYADRYQEYRRTVSILRKGLKGWTLDESFTSDFDAAFAAKLLKARTLLIPEMERWRSRRYRRGGKRPSQTVMAGKLRKMAGPFLRRGGNIVVLCPSRYQTEFLAKAGLLDVKVTSNGDRMLVPFTAAGRRLARRVGPSFRTANATTFYRIGSRIRATAWASNRKGAPIVARRVGSGWIILMGMDYYSKNRQTVQMLLNAVTLR